MKIIDHKDAINRRLYEGLMIVETPIYRKLKGLRTCNLHVATISVLRQAQ